MTTEEQVLNEQHSFTQEERMKIAGVILAGYVILSLVIIFTLGFWAWFAVSLVLNVAVAGLYVYQPEKFGLYSPKLLQLTDDASAKLQTTTVMVKDTALTVGKKTAEKTYAVSVEAGKKTSTVGARSMEIAQKGFRSFVLYSNPSALAGEATEVVKEAPPMILPDAVKSDEIVRQIIKISVPKSTKWEAERAKRFMDKLYAVARPLVFSIRATEFQITWMIEVKSEVKTPVVNSIQAEFPQATIEVSPKTKLDLGYYRYQIEVDTLSFAPYKDVLSLKQQDPLTGIVASMKNLMSGEEFVYELLIYPPTYNYTALAEQYLVKPLTVSWFQLLNDDIRDEVIARQALGTNKVEAYTEEISSAIREKASTLCFNTQFSIKIKAPSKERAENLYSDFVSSLEVFDRIPFNMLMSAKEGETYPLLLTSAEAAAIWHLPSSDIQTMGVDWSNVVVAPMPVQLAKAAETHKEESLLLGINQYHGRTYEVRLPYNDRITHVNLIGRTRVGKSTLMHHMIHQDIQNGKGVGVIDPHGSLVRDILTCSIPPERVKDVVLFDVNDKEFPVGLNLFAPEAGLAEDKQAGFILGVLRKVFGELWSAGRTEDVLYACIMSLIFCPGATIYDVPKLLTVDDYRVKVLRKLRDPVARDFWRYEYEPKSESGRLQFAQPVNNRLRKLFRDPDLRRILCQKRSINFRGLIDQNKIFLANLGGLAEVESEVIGSLLMSKIQQAAMSRRFAAGESHSTFYFYVDEVQNFVTTSLSTVLSEAAKFGLSMVIANQFLRQLEGETLNAVLGNIGTSIIFRVGTQDARILDSMVRPSASADDLENLDRFHTLVKMQLDGQTLPAFSMMTLPPLPPKDEADATIEDIQNRSRSEYGTHRDDVDKELGEGFSDDDDSADDESDDSDTTPDSDDKFSG